MMVRTHTKVPLLKDAFMYKNWILRDYTAIEVW